MTIRIPVSALRRCLRSGLIVAAVAAATSLSLPAMAETLNFYTYTPLASSPTVRGQLEFAKMVAKDTNGQTDVRVHLGGSLPIQAANITGAVSDNNVQLADDAFFAGIIPLAEGLRLPRLFHSQKEATEAAKLMEPYIRRAYEKRGVTLLATYIYPEQVLWSHRKLTSLADLKNQKIRVITPGQGIFVKKFGGVPVTLGTAEVTAALDRAVIEGVVTASSGGAFIFKDLLKYNYRIAINYAQSYMIANKEAFEKLPAATQAIIKADAVKAYDLVNTELATEDQNVTDKLRAGGMTITAATPADEAEADKQFASYWDEWAKGQGPEAIEMMKKIRDSLGR